MLKQIRVLAKRKRDSHPKQPLSVLLQYCGTGYLDGVHSYYAGFIAHQYLLECSMFFVHHFA